MKLCADIDGAQSINFLSNATMTHILSARTLDQLQFTVGADVHVFIELYFALDFSSSAVISLKLLIVKEIDSSLSLNISMSMTGPTEPVLFILSLFIIKLQSYKVQLSKKSNNK